MFRFMSFAAISVALTATTFAQDAPDPGQDRPRPRRQQQDGAQGQDGERGQRGGRRGGQFGGPGMGFMGGQGGGRMMDRFVEELNLDEQQKLVFDELMAPQRERMRQMGEKLREMREAQDAGDTERADQIRAEMRAAGMGPGGPGGGGRGPGQMAEAMNDVLDQLEPSLREDQLEKLDEMRDRMERGQQGMDAARRVRDELPDTLNLDESQRTQFEEMLSEERNAMRQQFETMGPLFEKMREAREAGDEATLADLRKQMEANQPDFSARTAAFLDRVEGLLTPEQKTLLEQFRDEIGAGPAGEAAEGYVDVKDLIRIAKRVRLTAEQKDEFKDIERSAAQDNRKVGRDKDARAALSEKVRREIEELLDETQRNRFAQQLERLQRRNAKR